MYETRIQNIQIAAELLRYDINRQNIFSQFLLRYIRTIITSIPSGTLGVQKMF